MLRVDLVEVTLAVWTCMPTMAWNHGWSPGTAASDLLSAGLPRWRESLSVFLNMEMQIAVVWLWPKSFWRISTICNQHLGATGSRLNTIPVGDWLKQTLVMHLHRSPKLPTCHIRSTTSLRTLRASSDVVWSCCIAQNHGLQPLLHQRRIPWPRWSPIQLWAPASSVFDCRLLFPRAVDLNDESKLFWLSRTGGDCLCLVKWRFKKSQVV